MPTFKFLTQSVKLVSLLILNTSHQDLLLLLCSPAISLGFTMLGEIFVYVTIFQSNHWGSHIPSLLMAYAWCIFVAGNHPSRTRMSESFQSVWCNACVHRLDLSLCSHPKEFDRTHGAASSSTTSPTHYQLSYSEFRPPSRCSTWTA